MEDEEGIGLILARATELRLKISDCIDRSSTAVSEDGGGSGGGNEDALESLESQVASLQVNASYEQVLIEGRQLIEGEKDSIPELV